MCENGTKSRKLDKTWGWNLHWRPLWIDRVLLEACWLHLTSNVRNCAKMREREIDKCDSLTKYDSMLFAAIVGGDCDMGNDDIWQNYWTANKRITKILLLLTMVSTNVDIVCQEDLPVRVNPVEHFFTILFKHSQLKALIKLVLLQLPQLQNGIS